MTTATQAPAFENAQSTPFTAHDRCDGCKAQAYTEFKNSAQQSLLFCGHHTVKHEVKLMEQGFQMVRDNRPTLVARESKQRDAGSAV